VTGSAKAAVIARRGKEARNIAKVAAARKLLTLVHYGLRQTDPRSGQARPRRPAARRGRVTTPGQRPGTRPPSILPSARREAPTSGRAHPAGLFVGHRRDFTDGPPGPAHDAIRCRSRPPAVRQGTPIPRTNRGQKIKKA
jgi:hypothetical protein